MTQKQGLDTILSPPPLSLHLLDEVFGVRRHVIWKRQIHLCICVGVLATFKAKHLANVFGKMA